MATLLDIIPQAAVLALTAVDSEGLLFIIEG